MKKALVIIAILVVCASLYSCISDNVGSSSGGRHTCEECSREGTHQYTSFTGRTEYYCTTHYNKLMAMFDALIFDALK